MRKLVVGIVLVAACGGGDDGVGPSDAPVRIDTATPADAPPTIDARQPDAPPVGGDCNILTQTGCAAGQKCTWIRVSTTPPLGEVGCAPAGPVDTFGACTYGPTGSTTGYDNCIGGDICLANPQTDQATGLCREICSLMDATAPCPTDFACGTYYRFFSNSDGDTPVAGVCDPTCDPLSGVRNFDDAPFCGGPNGDPSDPLSLGCYGFPSGDTDPTKFTCSSQGVGGHRSVVTGPVFLNSCASGAIPLMYESSTSTNVICVMTCQPRNCNADIRMTDPGCWRGTTPYRTTDRGCTAAGEECKYLWWFEDASTPTTALSDGVGFCVDYTKYRWDSDGNGSDDSPWVACRASLDINTQTDPMAARADWFWGCVETSMIPPSVAPQRRRPKGIDLRPLLDADAIRASAAGR